jgi:SAM-dependent methyltransferase
MAVETNQWPSVEHARAYLEFADTLPHRAEAQLTLLEFLPERVGRVLDLGTGDGRLLALVRTVRPGAAGLAVDLNEHMLAEARARFAGDSDVEVRAHDLEDPLPADGAPYDAVVSSFAIHHVPDERKRLLYAEAFALLRPGGAFLNLEHVASSTEQLHEDFRVAIGQGDEPDDPSNLLAPVEDQLSWLRAIGFADVDCQWKWREIALLAGVRPV